MKAKRSAGQGLAENVGLLEKAVSAARGHLDESVVAAAETVVTRARERGSLAPGTTVAALLGATGSGKSSLLNAVVGDTVARVAPTRPTTDHPQAVTFAPGPDGAGATSDLLDWLGVTDRIARPPGPRPIGTTGPKKARPSAPADADSAGLVLLDLPDIDSTVAAHRDLAASLAERVDVLVWVLDPQKYADAVVHREFLAPMSRHADVTLVVLNHADTLGADSRAAVTADLRRILAEDGLGDVPVLLASARTGEGVHELVAALGRQARSQVAAHARLTADVRTAADALAEAAGLDGASSGGPSGKDARRAAGGADVVEAAGAAAGIPLVEHAAADSYRAGALRHVGWPPVRWVSRLRRDPLRRLGLRAGSGVERATSLPPASPAQVSTLNRAVRAHADARAAELPSGWRMDVTSDVESRLPALLAHLDGAVSAVDLGQDRRPAWWKVIGALQWLMLAAAVVGGLWLAALALVGYLRMPEIPTPDIGGWPVPTLLLIGGVAVGLLLWLIGAQAARVGAARRARAVRRRLAEAVATHVDAEITRPLTQHVEGFGAFRDALATIRR
jgi:GTP-binding protein EngB required for normal cell division